MVEGVTLLERLGSEMMLDVPAGGVEAGEKLALDVLLAQAGEQRNLVIEADFKSAEPCGDGREIVTVTVGPGSVQFLDDIVRVFEERQREALLFLKEAKGA